MSNPFRYFNSSPEIIRLAVLMYVKYPLSLRNVEDLLAERGIDISHETVRFWWNRFGPMFAASTRARRGRRCGRGVRRRAERRGARAGRGECVERQVFDVGDGETWAFNPGDLLFEERFNRAALDQLFWDLGEGPYNAQILQLSVISLFEGV